MITREENIELSGRHGHANVEDLLIWIAKQTDGEGRAILLNPTAVMVDEMFAVGRSDWVRRHIQAMKDLRVMQFQYGRGVTGDNVASMRRMANALVADLAAMHAKWGIDDMTVPEWCIVDGNVEVKFRYESAGYAKVAG